MTTHAAFRRLGPATIIAMLLAACAAGPGPSHLATDTASQTSDPARTPSAECVRGEPDLMTLINQINPAACYGDTPITVDAEVTSMGAIDCAPVEPAWFGCGSWVALRPIVGARSTGFALAATTGGPTPPWMFATIHPDTAVSRIDLEGEQLRITGHFDDPAAQTCVETEAPFGGPSTPPDEVIASCRNLFVLTAFERI